MRLRALQVVEAGLGHLPFTEQVVTTPTGYQYVGVRFASKLCGVSIIRSGESLEAALRDCCKGIKIGKILVHRHRGEAGAEDIVYEKLPKDIADRWVEGGGGGWWWWWGAHRGQCAAVLAAGWLPRAAELHACC